MKFIRQFLIILAISLIGEILKYILPLPIPASIYGMAILFAGLMSGLIKLDAVRETGKFLIEIMPLMFIPAAVGLIESWKTIGSKIGTYLIITVLSTIFVMIVAGHTTQAFIRFSKSKDNQERKDS